MTRYSSTNKSLLDKHNHPIPTVRSRQPLSHLIRTPSSDKNTSMMFGCDNCPKTFSSSKAFVAHWKTNCGRDSHIHDHDPQQAISLSPFPTPSLDKKASMIIECDNCDKSFLSKAFVAHWKANCGRDLSPTCDLCDRPYKSKRALEKHLKTYCHLCETSFFSSQAFEQGGKFDVLHGDAIQTSHQHHRDLAAHTGIYCRMCYRFFKDESTKEQHMCDPADEDTFCAICNKIFKYPRDLRNHLSSPTHKRKNASCFVCPSKFRTPSGVALHLESGCKELPLNRYQITAAVNLLNIAPKISLRHSVEGSSLATPRPLMTYQAFESSFDGSAYQCPICPKMFRALYSLEAHLNSPAHDEDEFKCPKCSTHFKLVSGLVQHLESGSCGLSNLKDVERRFADMQAQLSKSLKF